MTAALRRSITVPLFLILATGTPLLFALLPLFAVVDLIRSKRWALVRAFLFFAHYLLCEAVGIIAAAALWLRFKLIPGMAHADYMRANFRLQCRWASALYRGIELVYAIQTSVTGDDSIVPGPILVFPRHASTGDTILPAAFLSSRHNILLRYVLKRELLWDPCLDIVGNRLPNHFVDRRSVDSSREIEAVAALADDLAEDEGVLIYPEGTRFSEQKRSRALEKLTARHDADLLEIAESMRNVLPPRTGGPTALIQRYPRTDVVILAHTGFEGVESLATLVNGSLVGRHVRLRFWRIPRSEIPSDTAQIQRWLFETWKRVDEWIDENRARTANELASRPESED